LLRFLGLFLEVLLLVFLDALGLRFLEALGSREAGVDALNCSAMNLANGAMSF